MTASQDVADKLLSAISCCAGGRTEAEIAIFSAGQEAAALITKLSEEKWQPIETAPRDKSILVFNELWGMSFGEIQVARLIDDTWYFDSGMLVIGEEGVEFFPTHWMPLPLPPSTESGSPAGDAL